MKPLISLKDIGVRYKRTVNTRNKSPFFEILKKVNFDIYPGETLGIIGKNGVGKSTLLRVIAGITKPDNGKVINDHSSVSLLSLHLGFIQEISGRDNAILSGMLLGFTHAEMMQKLSAIQEFSELGDFFYEPLKSYSSGMTSRLGFSINMSVSPDVLLVDEVLSVGDANFKKKAEAEMRRKLSSNQTVVFVSHSAQQVKRLCDRVVLIENGISVFTGSPDEAFKIYENTQSVSEKSKIAETL